jgi:hypothetical protein
MAVQQKEANRFPEFEAFAIGQNIRIIGHDIDCVTRIISKGWTSQLMLPEAYNPNIHRYGVATLVPIWVAIFHLYDYPGVLCYLVDAKKWVSVSGKTPFGGGRPTEHEETTVTVEVA